MKTTTASGKQTVTREQPAYLAHPWWYVRLTGNSREDNRFPSLMEALAWAEEREVERLIVEVEQGGPTLTGMTLAEAKTIPGIKVYTGDGLYAPAWATAQYTEGADGRLSLWRANWDSSG